MRLCRGRHGLTQDSDIDVAFAEHRASDEFVGRFPLTRASACWRLRHAPRQSNLLWGYDADADLTPAAVAHFVAVIAFDETPDDLALGRAHSIGTAHRLIAAARLREQQAICSGVAKHPERIHMDISLRQSPTDS